MAHQALLMRVRAKQALKRASVNRNPKAEAILTQTINAMDSLGYAGDLDSAVRIARRANHILSMEVSTQDYMID